MQSFLWFRIWWQFGWICQIVLQKTIRLAIVIDAPPFILKKAISRFSLNKSIQENKIIIISITLMWHIRIKNRKISDARFELATSRVWSERDSHYTNPTDILETNIPYRNLVFTKYCKSFLIVKGLLQQIDGHFLQQCIGRPRNDWIVLLASYRSHIPFIITISSFSCSWNSSLRHRKERLCH